MAKYNLYEALGLDSSLPAALLGTELAQRCNNFRTAGYAESSPEIDQLTVTLGSKDVTMTKTKKILTAVVVVLGVFVLGHFMLDRGTGGSSSCYAFLPEKVEMAYTEDSDIYSGQLGPVIPELSDSKGWVFRFTVNKIVRSGKPDTDLLVKQYKSRENSTTDKPLTEGLYLMSLGSGSGGNKPIERADRITSDEAAEINGVYDAQDILRDNHAFVYPVQGDKGK